MEPKIIAGHICHSPIRNYVLPGLTSWLVGQPKPDGSKTRIFEMSRRQMDFVVPHSHKFDFTATTLQGIARNMIWLPSDNGDLYQKALLEYQNEPGKYTMRIVDGNAQKYNFTCERYKEGESYSMRYHEIHSVKFSYDAVIMINEGPTLTDRSVILQPFVDGELLETIEVKKWMFKTATT